MPMDTVPNPPPCRDFQVGTGHYGHDYGVLAVAEQIVRATVVPGCPCGMPRSEYEGHNCSANHWRWTPWPVGGVR